MRIVMSPETIANAFALEVVGIPKKVLGRGYGPVPRGWPLNRFFWRLMVEVRFLRYMTALLPVPLLMWARPDLALLVAHSPVPMFVLVYLVETRVFSITSPEARKALISDAEADRVMDALGTNARAALQKIAAGRGLKSGVLHLVIEQSELARVPPLTVISVQAEGRANTMLALDAAERDMVEKRLFDGVDERDLLRVTLARQDPVQSFSFDAAGVSAHARLAALAG